MGNRIRCGDTVEVISGDDRGMRVRGVVQRFVLKKNRVVVSEVNIVRKHQRPIRAGRRDVQAGIIEFEAPIHVSNVMLVCPRCNQCTRVGFAWQEHGQKVRVCQKCGEAIG